MTPTLTAVVRPKLVDRVSGVERPPCSVCGEPLYSPASLQDILKMFGVPLCPRCEKIPRSKP